MTDLLTACYRGLDPFIRLFGCAPGAWVVESEGALTSVVPGIPHAWLFNSTMYDRARPETLDGALVAAKREYEAADVRALGAWILDGDAAAQRVATAHGLTLDSVPRAMGAVLSELDLGSDVSAVSERWDMTAATRLNELAYAVPPGMFAPVSQTVQPPGARCFIAESEGEAVASVVTLPNGDDCAIFWVATDPVHQGLGFARAAMVAALKAAVADGFRTTTLQSSKAGAPLYLRLGYSDLGRSVNLWKWVRND
ncbi:MAG: GNAT family N-acetyltransferase [Thermoleophilaceae bacterium]|nr:GNAT family N-acetyltransferase [Thermoleophilaceae bacterium]